MSTCTGTAGTATRPVEQPYVVQYALSYLWLHRCAGCNLGPPKQDGNEVFRYYSPRQKELLAGVAAAKQSNAWQADDDGGVARRRYRDVSGFQEIPLKRPAAGTLQFQNWHDLCLDRRDGRADSRWPRARSKAIPLSATQSS